ncbi:MAG: glutamate--tRNA ligase family protein [Candidatus Paceibacterota bacterium]
MSKVVTRFAPSPTGLLHSGNYRTAVFAYLFAKKHDGEFLVRIEDTDRARSKVEYEDNIFETLQWLDFQSDREISRSSDRIDRHKEMLTKLIAEDFAYVSHEPKKDDADQMVDVVRFRNPGTTVTFHDEIRGDITFDTTEHGDFVVARAVDDPLFHFAVIVDDGDAGVTHVVRGEDHISNTPRQILIQQALGYSVPVYAHLPLILGSDRTKMSKRKGAKALTHYRDMGILPEAMLNYLALLGWNPGDDREYLSREELVDAFDLSRVQKGSAIFDEVKLLSVNQHWMRKLSDQEFIERGQLTGLDNAKLLKAVPLLKERAHTFTEAREMLAGELSCLFIVPALDQKALVAKEPADRTGLTKTALEGVLEAVKALPDGVSAEAVKDTLMPLADAEEAKGKGGRGGVLWPLRYALSGQERSPDPFTLISILGREEAVSRIQKAIAILS